ncbi:MAG TPA: glycosyltransferase family 2 protein [Candidatus Dormibacteraeota bacterium]|nr:glycosyltransferase family 2 protein [Candidatus Dormibacteraeota bacterium]
MSRVSIVVPVYHNAASLDVLLERLDALAARNLDDAFEFVFVDDGSRDESFAVLQRLLGEDDRVRVVKLSRNFGSTPAIIAGLHAASGDAVAAIAADLQDPPELIHEMLARWREGNKVVLAVREGRDDPGMTSLLSSIFYKLFRRFAIPSMPQGGFDFFLIDRQVCDLICGVRETNTYVMGLILWFGFRPIEIPYRRGPRLARFGRSMWSLSRRIKYFIDSFVAFSYFPIRIASVGGLILSFLGMVYAAAVILLRVVKGYQPEGWASLMVVVLVVSGVQLFIMGILGEYLWRTLDVARNRPQFVVERFLGFPERKPERASVESEAMAPLDRR